MILFLLTFDTPNLRTTVSPKDGDICPIASNGFMGPLFTMISALFLRIAFSAASATACGLDALTILEKKGKVQGLRIAICGDILHSRVARSNIYLLNMLGAEVNIIAPTNLMPRDIEKFGVNKFSDMKKGLKDCDIVMMLRLQNERMNSSFLASNREYYEYYGLTPDKLDYAKNDALIMHPGPMNRGIEIDTNLADDINKSVIQEQVELGVAVRMACLKIFCT